MNQAPLQLDTELLLQWYDTRRRILPWREDPTPYHVWISEIMLQQTRVDAVVPYYERFLAALPDVKALADAEEEVCLKLWEGLGYYSRIRNMHKAARQIMDEYGGQIPGTSKELQNLAGSDPLCGRKSSARLCPAHGIRGEHQIPPGLKRCRGILFPAHLP